MIPEEEQRESCPQCGEAVSLAATLCPFCRASLLVRCVLEGPVSYASDRSRIARALAALGRPVKPEADLAQALASARPLIASGLTRRAGRRLAAAVAAQGLPWALEPDTSATPGREGRTVALWGLGGAGLGLVLAAILVFARGGPRLTPEAVAKRALPATVALSCEDAVGTGFFVAERTLLTNAHVLCEADSVEARTHDGRKFQARVVRRDPDLDLAVLEAQGYEGAVLPTGDATELQAGEPLVMVGTPVGLAHTVHSVKVSRVGQVLRGTTYVQIEGDVNPGNSGGPIVDMQGRVVGVVTLRVESARGIGLALPINYATTRSAFIPGPPERNWRGRPTEATERFDRLLEEARRENDAEAARLRTAFGEPGLVEVVRTRSGEAVAIVALRSGWRPVGRLIPLQVTRGGRYVCGGDANFDWVKPDELGDDAGPFVRWLERNELADDLYFGAALLNGCGRFQDLVGAEVALTGSDASGSRIKISG